MATSTASWFLGPCKQQGPSVRSRNGRWGERLSLSPLGPGTEARHGRLSREQRQDAWLAFG